MIAVGFQFRVACLDSHPSSVDDWLLMSEFCFFFLTCEMGKQCLLCNSVASSQGHNRGTVGAQVF